MLSTSVEVVEENANTSRSKLDLIQILCGDAEREAVQDTGGKITVVCEGQLF